VISVDENNPSKYQSNGCFGVEEILSVKIANKELHKLKSRTI
jgi:hypothetical protein